jgi:hypothetical protein
MVSGSSTALRQLALVPLGGLLFALVTHSQRGQDLIP